jgi:fructose-specific phosphotransferase system IIC component
MRPSQSGSIISSLLGIVVCGGIGGLTAWVIVTQLHWDGLFGAIAAVLIGMAIATAAFAALTSLLDRFRGPR